MVLKLKRQILSFGREIAVYALLMAGYLFVVLRYLAEWLHQLFLHDRKAYALVALAAVVVQGLVLDQLTRLLLHLVRADRRADE
jgi:predicted PurR-regulated permease PerM